MGDRYCVDISIGGEITKEQISDLWVFVLRASVGWDWGDEYKDHQAEEFVKHVYSAVKEGRPFCLYDSSGNHTTFVEIVPFCRKHGLSYLIHEEQFADYAEEYKWWTPEMGKENSVLAVSGSEAIPVKQLKDHLDAYVGQATLCVQMLEQLIITNTAPDIPALTIKE
jgi:hypothetical protein